MQATEMDKLRIIKEIRKEAKYLISMGYGDLRFGKQIPEVNNEPAQDTDDE